MSASEFQISGQKFQFKEGSSFEWESRPGGWWILKNLETGQRYRVKMTQKGEAFSVSFLGKNLHGKILQKSYGSAQDSEGESSLIAQFPGKVRKVMVKEGEPVKKGQPLLLVEAMKMEFGIEAPYSGKVKKLLVKADQQIQPGDRFLEIEKK